MTITNRFSKTTATHHISVGNGRGRINRIDNEKVYYFEYNQKTGKLQKNTDLPVYIKQIIRGVLNTYYLNLKIEKEIEELEMEGDDES